MEDELVAASSVCGNGEAETMEPVSVSVSSRLVKLEGIGSLTLLASNVLAEEAQLSVS